MIKKEIYKLRDKLNKLINDGADYSIIYSVSEELDSLIVEYYNEVA